MTDRETRSSAHWRHEFDSFVARKTHAAQAVSLPPYVTDVDRPPLNVIRLDQRWAHHLFDGPFYLTPARDRSRPGCSLVFVQSADGNTGADDPSTLGGGETDKHLIYEGLSRVAADAVLAGAGTVRGSGTVFSVWHPELLSLRLSLNLPRHPTQIVATRHGVDVESELLFNVPEIPVIVLTSADGEHAMHDAIARRPWITTLAFNDANGLAVALAQLYPLGIRQISCIGGRRLARQLIDAGLIDDLYLTTAPRPGGEPNTPLHERPLSGRLIVRKRGTGPEAGVVFEHWQL